MQSSSSILDTETKASFDDISSAAQTSASSASSISQEINRAFKDFNVVQLGFLDSQFIVNNTDIDEDINTFSILRIHILRLQLLGFYFMIKQMITVKLILLDVTLVISMIINIISFSYFTQIDKLFRLIIKLFKFTTTNVDCYSINFLFDFLPKKKPKSITMIEYTTELALQPPPPIPQPYLDSNKQMVIPPHDQVAAILNLQSEYVIQHRIHKLNENIRIINNFIKIIVWSSLINIKTVQLVLDISYENLRSMIIKEFQVQLGTMNYDRGIIISLIPLIRINNEVFDPLDLLEPVTNVSTNSSNDWEDDTRKEMQILLNFEKITDLTIMPHSDTIKFYDKPDLKFDSTIIFQKPYNFSFKCFILGLHHYQKNATKIPNIALSLENTF